MSWSLIEFPLIIFALTFVVLWLSAETGLYLRRRHDPGRNERQDLTVILTATLTLLGLVIGFSFSMAVTRYDQRKNYEENEATAIGTGYVRAGLLPPAEVAISIGLDLATPHQQARYRFPDGKSGTSRQAPRGC